MINKEWMEISRDLEDHHAIFYELWQIGHPVFTDEIETAAIRFSSGGDFVEFLFNQEYWDNLTPYERLFVIAHECLHVILNHGVRTKNAIFRDRANRALDVVVNHLLVDSFGFDRARIRDQDVLCWIDTVFKGDNTILPRESYEYYYRNMPETPIVEVFTIDDHSEMENAEEIIKRLNDLLSAEEKQSIYEVLKNNNAPGACDIGNGFGGWSFVSVEPVKPKRKWETVILRWSLKYFREQFDEQWARIARRFELLPNDILLPSEMETDVMDFHKVAIHLYLDTSGSCEKYKDRFFRAAMSLPEDRFEVRLFCFDTKVEETTLKSGRIYGGGGTNFGIIEANIKKGDYPEGIFVITDGMGTHVHPQHPNRWHWFLTNRSNKHFIPQESKTYKLDDFE